LFCIVKFYSATASEDEVPNGHIQNGHTPKKQQITASRRVKSADLSKPSETYDDKAYPVQNGKLFVPSGILYIEVIWIFLQQDAIVLKISIATL
jgi:hypothetical protein